MFLLCYANQTIFLGLSDNQLFDIDNCCYVKILIFTFQVEFHLVPDLTLQLQQTFIFIIASDQPDPSLLREDILFEQRMPTWGEVKDDFKWSPYQVTPKYWNPWNPRSKRQLLQDMHFRFTVGTDNCAERLREYCNGPLKSLTPYRWVSKSCGSGDY